MSKSLVAFAAIAALACLGVDYANQSRHAGLGLVGLAPADYVAGVKLRITDQKAAKAAERKRNELLALPPREHLPPAPDGWIRRDYSKADRARLDRTAEEDAASLPPELQQNAQFATMVEVAERQLAERIGREVFVYEKGDALISMKLARKDPKAPGGLFGDMQADALQMVAANIAMLTASEGYAVVQGVPFIEVESMLSEPDAEGSVRAFTARLGDELVLSIRALATDEEILAVMNALDFDRLNGLLSSPLDGIGSAAPDLPPEAQKAAAQQAADDQRRLNAHEGRLAELRVQQRGLEVMKISGTLPEDEYARQKAELERKADKIGRDYSREIAALKAEREARPDPAAQGGAARIAIKPVLREIGAGCATKGGSKFCSVGD
jgi:hypothetical protein